MYFQGKEEQGMRLIHKDALQKSPTHWLRVTSNWAVSFLEVIWRKEGSASGFTTSLKKQKCYSKK